MNKITHWKVTDLHPHIEWSKIDHETYLEHIGEINLAKGTVIVKIYISKKASCEDMIRVSTNYNGRFYYYPVYKNCSRRFCTTLAKRFMKEVVQLSECNNE